jgi:hypothetical protein
VLDIVERYCKISKQGSILWQHSQVINTKIY